MLPVVSPCSSPSNSPSQSPAPSAKREKDGQKGSKCRMPLSPVNYNPVTNNEEVGRKTMNSSGASPKARMPLSGKGASKGDAFLQGLAIAVSTGFNETAETPIITPRRFGGALPKFPMLSSGDGPPADPMVTLADEASSVGKGFVNSSGKGGIAIAELSKRMDAMKEAHRAEVDALHASLSLERDNAKKQREMADSMTDAKIAADKELSRAHAEIRDARREVSRLQGDARRCEDLEREMMVLAESSTKTMCQLRKDNALLQEMVRQLRRKVPPKERGVKLSEPADENAGVVGGAAGASEPGESAGIVADLRDKVEQLTQELLRSTGHVADLRGRLDVMRVGVEEADEAAMRAISERDGARECVVKVVQRMLDLNGKLQIMAAKGSDATSLDVIVEVSWCLKGAQEEARSVMSQRGGWLDSSAAGGDQAEVELLFGETSKISSESSRGCMRGEEGDMSRHELTVSDHGEDEGSTIGGGREAHALPFSGKAACDETSGGQGENCRDEGVPDAAITAITPSMEDCEDEGETAIEMRKISSTLAEGNEMLRRLMDKADFGQEHEAENKTAVDAGSDNAAAARFEEGAAAEVGGGGYIGGVGYSQDDGLGVVRSDPYKLPDSSGGVGEMPDYGLASSSRNMAAYEPVLTSSLYDDAPHYGLASAPSTRSEDEAPIPPSTSQGKSCSRQGAVTPRHTQHFSASLTVGGVDVGFRKPSSISSDFSRPPSLSSQTAHGASPAPSPPGHRTGSLHPASSIYPPEPIHPPTHSRGSRKLPSHREQLLEQNISGTSPPPSAHSWACQSCGAEAETRDRVTGCGPHHVRSCPRFAHAVNQPSSGVEETRTRQAQGTSSPVMKIFSTLSGMFSPAKNTSSYDCRPPGQLQAPHQMPSQLPPSSAFSSDQCSQRQLESFSYHNGHESHHQANLIQPSPVHHREEPIQAGSFLRPRSPPRQRNLSKEHNQDDVGHRQVQQQQQQQSGEIGLDHRRLDTQHMDHLDHLDHLDRRRLDTQHMAGVQKLFDASSLLSALTSPAPSAYSWNELSSHRPAQAPSLSSGKGMPCGSSWQTPKSTANSEGPDLLEKAAEEWGIAKRQQQTMTESGLSGREQEAFGYEESQSEGISPGEENKRRADMRQERLVQREKVLKQASQGSIFSAAAAGLLNGIRGAFSPSPKRASGNGTSSFLSSPVSPSTPRGPPTAPRAHAISGALLFR